MAIPFLNLNKYILHFFEAETNFRTEKLLSTTNWLANFENKIIHQKCLPSTKPNVTISIRLFAVQMVQIQTPCGTGCNRERERISTDFCRFVCNSLWSQHYSHLCLNITVSSVVKRSSSNLCQLSVISADRKHVISDAMQGWGSVFTFIIHSTRCTIKISLK